MKNQIAKDRQEEYLNRIREFFTNKFIAPRSPGQVSEDVREVLESPIFKQQIFANALVGIMDASDQSYRYLSPHAETIFGVEHHILMQRGFMGSLELIVPEDMAALSGVIEKTTELLMGLPRESRLHLRLHYSCRINTPKGLVRLFQQTIPLALNENGYPYLQLAIISDVSEFKVEHGISYKAFVNEPGKPIEVLFTGSSASTANPLTDREKEIVLQMADGLDANAIADKLFLSEGTVRTHRKNVLKKTGAKNSVHLVRMAVANGWV